MSNIIPICCLVFLFLIVQSSYGGGMYGGGMYPVGPFRSEGNAASLSSISALNCRGFSETCRWSNTNEDELDWKVRSAAPESETWIPALDSITLPDQSAAVISSSSGSGYEVGQLVSDQLPCMTSSLQLTATVWRTVSGAPHEQPSLQVCSRNVRNDLPVSNCHKVPVQNGVPVTVTVPIPRDPLSPTQIILVADNFVGTGGAIFVQDIFVEGRLEDDCALAALDNRVETVDGATHWKDSDNAQLPDVAPAPAPVLAHHTTPYPGRAPARMQNFGNDLGHDTFYDACVSLSCNPAESECKWIAGNRGWITAIGQRFSNPLTGVQLPPPGMKSFLVAPFTSEAENSYQMISSLVTIPPSPAAAYFCFYEYFATEGTRLAICLDKGGRNCVYSRNEIELDGVDNTETNRKWRYRCAQMPSGTYEVYVTAENRGPNKGDIGFVPVTVTYDINKRSALCERGVLRRSKHHHH